MGWPYRLQDWEQTGAVAQGFVLERDEEVIGTAMWWPYGPSFASVGMIIITPPAQGSGNGRCLFDALLHAACDRTLPLNLTEEGLNLYLRRSDPAF